MEPVVNYDTEREAAMSTDSSASQQELRTRISKGSFAIALRRRASRDTGNTWCSYGHRRPRAWPQIIQVASVSGGSITNAFVAQRCRLDKLKPGELDRWPALRPP
jgi:hypothetical protein